uniref:C3H1-type domain-containing protein n=1 Tax=Macrostomum lignano TaxID=282301 RepID=A0A1I8FI72_9PLAT
MANLDDDDNKASGPKDDTIGSLLSPNEAYSRKRRTPGASEKQQQLAPDNGAGVARRRQSRTPEGAGGASGGRDGRAERRFAKARNWPLLKGIMFEYCSAGIRPECLRQSLSDLMIRPVQAAAICDAYIGRLAQVYPFVAFSSTSTKRNEPRTYALPLFDVMNKVENFPPYLLSAHRTIVDRFDVVEVGSSGTGICRPGAGLNSVLLTDYFAGCQAPTSRLLLLLQRPRLLEAEAAAERSRIVAPSGPWFDLDSNAISAAKPLRYLELLPLNSLYTIFAAPAVDPEDRRRLFAIECRLAAYGGASLMSYPFALAEPLRSQRQLVAPNDEPFEVAANSSTVNEASTLASGGGRDKSSILRSVCEQIGRVTCCPNPRSTCAHSHSDPRVSFKIWRTISRALLAAATAAAPSASTQQQPDKPCPAMMADDGFEGNQPESPMMTFGQLQLSLMMRMLTWLYFKDAAAGTSSRVAG